MTKKEDPEILEKKKKVWGARWVGGVVAGILGVILILLIGIVGFLVWFSCVSGIRGNEIGGMVRETVGEIRREEEERGGFLLMGADEEERSNGGILTDTIVLVVLDFDKEKVTNISIPRDLWLSEWQTKINAIYYYGEEDEGKTGESFLREEIEKITGVEVGYWVLVDFNTLKSVVDALGGVEVDVPRGFVDEKFPLSKSKVDRNVPSPTIYETVAFKEGVQVMDGERVLKYVRSRQTEEEEERGDVARGRRQQQVIGAVGAKFSDFGVWVNPEVVGRLYRVWREQVGTNLGEGRMVSLGYKLWRGNFSFGSLVLPTEGDEAVLVNPMVSKYRQWVFEPRGGDFGVVREYIEKGLQ